jgi:hypothetical protein
MKYTTLVRCQNHPQQVFQRAQALNRQIPCNVFFTPYKTLLANQEVTITLLVVLHLKYSRK